jgi:hypothetical protein
MTIAGKPTSTEAYLGAYGAPGRHSVVLRILRAKATPNNNRFRSMPFPYRHDSHRQRARITASGEAREIKPVMVGRKLTIHAFSSTSTARRDWGRRDRGKFLPARSLARLTTKDSEAPQAIVQTDGPEVHQQTLAHSEVGQNLRLVRQKQGDDGFDLNKDGVAEEDSARSRAGGVALVNDRNSDFPLERNIGLPEFVGQTLGINGFGKAGSSVAMHLDCPTNDPAAQVSMYQHTRSSCAFVVLRVLRGKSFESINTRGHFREEADGRTVAGYGRGKNGLLFPPQEHGGPLSKVRANES